jgi:hypothetical protein
VHIDSNDVFWMVPVEHDAVEVDFDDAQASVRVSGLQVFDDHDIANSLTFGLGLPGDLGFPYPAIKPVAPIRATVSFDVEWNGAVATEQIRNSSQQFEGPFLHRPLPTLDGIGWSSPRGASPSEAQRNRI